MLRRLPFSTCVMQSLGLGLILFPQCTRKKKHELKPETKPSEPSLISVLRFSVGCKIPNRIGPHEPLFRLTLVAGWSCFLCFIKPRLDLLFPIECPFGWLWDLWCKLNSEGIKGFVNTWLNLVLQIFHCYSEVFFLVAIDSMIAF